MNIFIREIKAHRKSLIIWSIGIILLVASSMGKYAGLSSSGQSMNELMGNMPKPMQAIMGIGTFDISKAIGYYGILFIYLVLMATIHAVMLGANIISKEEREKTSEFLFVKPTSRTKIIFSKLLASFVNIFIFNIVTVVSSILFVGKYSEGESIIGDIAITMTGMFILQLFFLVLGTAIAALMRNPKRATSISTGCLLITYILSVVIDLNEKLEGLKYFTPFKYFEAKNIMFGGGFETIYLVLSCISIVIFTVITFVFYQKRDLNV